MSMNTNFKDVPFAPNLTNVWALGDMLSIMYLTLYCMQLHSNELGTFIPPLMLRAMQSIVSNTFLWSTTCMWKPPLLGCGKKNLFFPTKFEGSKLWQLMKSLFLGFWMEGGWGPWIHVTTYTWDLELSNLEFKWLFKKRSKFIDQKTSVSCNELESHSWNMYGLGCCPHYWRWLISWQATPHIQLNMASKFMS